MPDKINIIFDANTLQEFGRRIKELAAKYVQTLNQPTQREERLLFEDVPMVEIRPKSISKKYPTQEEKDKRNAVGPLVGPIKDKDPKLIENGSKL